MTQYETMEATEEPGALADSLALFLSHLLSPAAVALAVFAWLMLMGGSRVAGMVGVGLFAVAPALSLWYLKRVGVLADVYNPDPLVRRRILVAGTMGYGLGYFILRSSGASDLMLWTGALFVSAGLVVWLIDRYWKISIHSVGVGGGLFILVAAGDLWVLSPALLMVGWARLRLKAHTPAQVVGGMALGSVLAVSLSVLYR